MSATSKGIATLPDTRRIAGRPALAGLIAIVVAGVAACGGEPERAARLAPAPQFRVIQPLPVAHRPGRIPATSGETAILATSVESSVLGISLTGRPRTLFDLSSPSEPVAVASPSWAPDGRSFVVSGVGLSRPRVMIVRLPGGRHGSIADDMFDPAPETIAFSPDGRHLLVPRRARGLFAYDLTRRRAQQVLAGPVADRSSVTWSPDGRRIAFGRKGGGIVLLDLRTRSVSLLTRDGGGAAWSPDGAWIAFATARGVTAQRCGEDGCGATTDIDVIHPDGTGRRRLTHTSGDETVPSWSPDSKWLVAELLPGDTYYEGNSHLVTLAADGSCYRRLGSDHREVLSLGPNAWRPGVRADPRC